MQEQRHFWKIFDFCADHVIRMAKKIPAVRQWLNSNVEHVDFMMAWFEENPTPPLTNASQYMMLDKPRLNEGNASLIYEQQEFVYTQTHPHIAYHLSVAQKIAALSLIKDYPDQLHDEQASDSDKENQKRKLQLGDYIDVLDDRNMWKRCEVIGVYGNGWVKIRSCNYLSQYRYDDDETDIEETDPRIAPDGKFSNYRRTHRGY